MLSIILILFFILIFLTKKYEHFNNLEKKYNGGMIKYKVYGKKNSLPNFINSLTTPVDEFGIGKGDSIFRIDYKDRGLDNEYKKRYKKKKKKKHINIYSNTIRKYLEKNIKSSKNILLFETCYKICEELTFLLHFGFLPSYQDSNNIKIFIDGVSETHQYLLLTKKLDLKKKLYNLAQFEKSIINYFPKVLQNQKPCIIYYWLKDGFFSKNDIFVEFIHNIIGMTYNWTNLIHKYLILLFDGSIPRFTTQMDINKYLIEVMRYVCPVAIISSNNIKKNKRVVQDLHSICQNKKYFKYGDNFNIKNIKYNKYKTKQCPFANKFYNSNKKAIIPNGLEIYETDGYVPFGEGYRRCPGEIISLKFLEIFINILSKYTFTINNQSEPDHNFIFVNVDKNAQISLK